MIKLNEFFCFLGKQLKEMCQCSSDLALEHFIGINIDITKPCASGQKEE